jgi:predicted CXXCH cytochrome family protein
VHNDVACERCHNRTAAELKDYVYDSADFPASDLCLSCHDAARNRTGPSPPYVVNGDREMAGGSFTPTLLSDDVGHNMAVADTTLGLTPPGGAPLTAFGCLSCHDAHANGNFRNLKKAINGRQTPVIATGDPNYQDNVYVSGMNDFCGACHERLYDLYTARGSRGWRRHPVGVAIYGSLEASFDAWSRLQNKVTQAQYPSGNSADLFRAEVFCLTCHRAHASPFKDAMRWDYSKTPQGCLECHAF